MMRSAKKAFLTEARRSFHAALLKQVLCIEKGIPSNADKHNSVSVDIARHIIKLLGSEAVGARLAGQMSGNKFEEVCAKFVQETFPCMRHLRPGTWAISRVAGRNRLEIARYEQYSHLVALDRAARKDRELAAALGNDYTITPDITIVRRLESDAEINKERVLEPV